MPSVSPIRAAFVLILIGCGMIALMGRVSYLQTYGREQTIRKADRQQHQSETLLSRRGCIYDSTGMLMAGTIQQKAMFIDPKFMAECFQEDGRTMSDMDQAINQIASILDKDSFELAQLLGEKAESRFVKIAENIDEGTAEQIEKLDLPGVGFMPMNVRYYPMGSIAAHVLGGTGKEGKGLEGVELRFEKMLAGKDGFKRTLKDARRRPLSVAADDYLPPLHGQHLILTLDANIQMIAEQELGHTCDTYKAKRGEAIVMDPKTGDVLAMANWPNFNPQSMEESAPETRRNRCLTDPYEPGSTAKPFVAGPALAWKFTRLNEVWPIHGPVWRTSYGRKVTDVHGYDQLATWDVLVKSSNIGMSMLGNRMGNQNLYKALTAFGFGRETGIDLPGEDPGLVNPLKQWTKYSTESVSQGYEMMVTPLQLARAFCAYANGGRLVQPRILKGVLDAEGNVVARNQTTGLQLLPEAIDPITAAEVKRTLCDTVIRGTATKARSRNWNIFGKTGTAHVAKNGNYNESAYTSSFMAGAPAENPRLVVVFIIHEPDREHAISQGLSYYGGAVAAPGAGHVLERSLAYLQVPASRELAPPPPQIASVLYNYNAKQYEKITASVAE
jgi:cell division protein FtsI/penicillin-binding protein 2